jgi:hypothetical protein
MIISCSHIDKIGAVFVARFQTLNRANFKNRIVVMHGSPDDSRFARQLRVLFASGARGMNVAPFQRKILEGDWKMLWTILVILLVLWLIGLLSHVGGGLIPGDQPGYRTAGGLNNPAQTQRRRY